MAALLKEYKDLFAEHDVEGLIGEGAPRDEYDQEATDVAQKLQDLKSAGTKLDHAVVLNVLMEIWGKSFNLKSAELETRREKLTKLATKVEELCVKP